MDKQYDFLESLLELNHTLTHIHTFGQPNTNVIHFQQVMYYDPESKSHGQWSRKRQYSTLRPGSGRRGHLGEDVRRRGEAGPGGGGGGGQNHQQEDKVDDHSEEDDQKEQHQKQRYNGLLNSSSKLQAGNAA